MALPGAFYRAGKSALGRRAGRAIWIELPGRAMLRASFVSFIPGLGPAIDRSGYQA